MPVHRDSQISELRIKVRGLRFLRGCTRKVVVLPCRQPPSTMVVVTQLDDAVAKLHAAEASAEQERIVSEVRVPWQYKGNPAGGTLTDCHSLAPLLGSLVAGPCQSRLKELQSASTQHVKASDARVVKLVRVPPPPPPPHTPHCTTCTWPALWPRGVWPCGLTGALCPWARPPPTRRHPLATRQQEEIEALRREAAERARGHESELLNQRKEITAAFEKVGARLQLRAPCVWVAESLPAGSRAWVVPNMHVP